MAEGSFHQSSSAALELLAPRFTTLMRRPGESEEAAARRAFDLLAMFEPGNVRAVADVMASRRAGEGDSQ